LAIAVGTPEEVAAEPASYTGRFLAELLTPTVSRNGAKPGKPAPGRRRAKVAA
jgi:excinuclease ABC subunit A